MRPGDHLAGGIPAVAPRLQDIKLRGRQLAGRVFFVYSESKISLPLRTIQGLLSVLPLIPRFILVLIPILVIFPEVFWIVVVIPDASGIAAA